MRSLAQADIDAVFGECDIDKYGLWCSAHQSRVHPLAVRCDSWRDFEDSVEVVIERLKEEQR